MGYVVQLYGQLLVLGIVVAGLLMMVAPELAKRVLKNLGVSVALFILGTILVQSCCSGLIYPPQ